MSSNPLVAEADRLYLRRQEGRVGDRGERGADQPGDRGLRQGRRRRPDLVEARWKLMRALYFKGAYTGLDAESRKAVFEKARRVGRGRDRDPRQEPRAEGIKGFLELGPEALAGKL